MHLHRGGCSSYRAPAAGKLPAKHLTKLRQGTELTSRKWHYSFWVVALSAVALWLAGCSTANPTVTSATRAATQTPWFIYIPVTTTPEPATITPLPTVTSA